MTASSKPKKDNNPTYSAARESYNPHRIEKKIDVLWIAESPPTGGGYFYFKIANKSNHLFRETMKALGWWPESETMHAGTDKSLLLTRFQQHGYFLIDGSEEPINDKKDKERERILSGRTNALLAELRRLKPTRILLIKKSTFNAYNATLKREGFDVLNGELIPFPGSGQQANYKKSIRRFLLPCPKYEDDTAPA